MLPSVTVGFWLGTCQEKMKQIVARARNDSNLTVGMPGLVGAKRALPAARIP